MARVEVRRVGKRPELSDLSPEARRLYFASRKRSAKRKPSQVVSQSTQPQHFRVDDDAVYPGIREDVNWGGVGRMLQIVRKILHGGEE